MNPFQAREIWPPGTVVDRKYIIRSTLGRGGFGTVYLAKHRVLGRDYVIKRLHSQFAEDPQFIDRFVKEAQAIAILKGCPQIVEVSDMTQTEDGQLVLVMEYMPGGDLAGLIRKEGRLNVPDAIWYARQIAEGLKAAHAAGFVHRDVKPQNVLLGADPKVAKLADFGIVTDRDRAGPSSVMRTGSEGFAAPEQWQYSGKHLDGRTDIYALGATTYLMLAGRMPYGELALRDWVTAIQAGPPPSLRTILDSVPAELDGLVLEMLAVDREKRPRDAGEVLARLDDRSTPKRPLPPLKRPEGVVEELGAVYTPTVKESVAPGPKPGPGAKSTRRFQVWPAILVCALLVVAIAGWFVYHSNNGMTPLPPAPAKEQPSATAKIEHKEETIPPTPSASKGPTTKLNDKDGLTYVWIPPRTFQMGCSQGDSECDDDEKPHEVTLTKGFWMGQTPVTQEAYKLVTGKAPSHFKGDQLPVEQVNWNEAQSYCQAVGMRLPTEAEWEYAARAGTTGSRYGGLDQIAWYDKNSGSTTHPVKQKLANQFGLYDMLGNVWEWMSDWYEKEYPVGAQRDPTGPASGQSRALRGGSWYDGAGYARASGRNGVGPVYRGNVIGLRCAGN